MARVGDAAAAGVTVGAPPLPRAAARRGGTSRGTGAAGAPTGGAPTDGATPVRCAAPLAPRRCPRPAAPAYSRVPEGPLRPTNDRPSTPPRSTIESDAATLLGLLSLEFARLDTALGLCVVSVDAGRRTDELTRQFDTASFDDRVAFLRKTVDRRFGDADPAREAYAAWLARADDARRARNHLVNGRVGFDPDTGRVVSVIGLPTSQDRRTRRYALDELRALVEALRALHADLGALRERFPL